MIRSLTIGLPLGTLAPSDMARQAADLIQKSRAILSAQGVEPRTVRFTLPAVGEAGEVEGSVLSSLRWVDALAKDNGVRWFCLPIDLTDPAPSRERLTASRDAVSRFPSMFLNMIVARDGAVAVKAANDAADLILKTSRRSNNGFDNFRVGASCNCPANAPFFPFSRHEGDGVAFSFALETTGIALDVTKNGGSDVGATRDRLVDALAPQLSKIDALGHELARQSGTEYRGLDASLAPFPDGNMSVATLIEQILGALPGSAGSVFVTALLTDALRAALARSGAKAVGFNGVMFSLLEDDHLAKANNRRGLNLDALIALASVCSCGIDMVPVSGTIFKEELAALILDIAAMSSTLKKPLGTRLLPIPGRGVNEFTQFNLDFLCDSRIMDVVSNDRALANGEHHLQFRAPLHERGTQE